MNDATLNEFRQIADAMGCGKDKTWTICRRYLDHSGHEQFSIVAFGYGKEEAERCAKYYKGGFAQQEADAMRDFDIRKRKVRTPQV